MNTTYTLHINITSETEDVITHTHQAPQLLQLMEQFGVHNIGTDDEPEFENTDQAEQLLNELGIKTSSLGETWYCVAQPTLRIVKDIVIPTHICATYDKDTNSFQPCETFCSYEEMADECGGYSASERTPAQHNSLETQRPLSERCIFVALEDLELESRNQLVCRSTLTQVYDQEDGGCKTFIPNWFNREHFEFFLNIKFENNEHYEDWLEDFQSDRGDQIAGIISTLIQELSQQHYAESNEE